ncbi:NAC domain-containing protein 71-like isoform X2 [Senna tora]|uniref:NAC domain-containing protein 71-like isoform X2 n=1 Tax=Senna tora TaxID=362788 RepID=A0A834U1J4_9FABA|nr:NAC domain-containing protein 71-like isoform X2 [Senna tora]
MGEPQSPSQCASLPPGCRFYPSEEQLLCYYLTNKNSRLNKEGNFCGCDLIREIDLYDHDPSELPDVASFSYGYRGRKRHWYYYTVKSVKGSRRKIRKVKSGYWMRQGRARDVLSSGGKVVLGKRTSFVFYSGNSSESAVRTDWMLYEYALIDHVKASFVLCRVFARPCCRNGVSEIGPSSWVEESVSAVRHIGIQHDEFVTPDAVEAKVFDERSIDRKQEISLYPLRCAGKLDGHQVLTAPVSAATFQCSVDPQGSWKERSSVHCGGAGMFVEAVTSQQHLYSILEEDFIELDDLT